MPKQKLTAKEKKFHLWVMEKGCCVPGCWREPVVFHHEKQKYPLPRRDHKFGVPLCDYHHREKLHNDFSWDLDRFNEAYGVQLEEVADYYMNEYWGKEDV